MKVDRPLSRAPKDVQNDMSLDVFKRNKMKNLNKKKVQNPIQSP